LVNAEELEIYNENSIFKNHIDKYKYYNTIRRDLRLAYSICIKLMELQKKIKDENNYLNVVKDELYLYRASMLHAIVLYAKWLKATNGKPTLNLEKYITENIKDYHDEIITLRDKYIVHQENDILGSDRVFISYDKSTKQCRIKSDFIEEVFLQKENLNLEHFKNCIETVHNKIDATDIPTLESKIIKFCKTNSDKNYNKT